MSTPAADDDSASRDARQKQRRWFRYACRRRANPNTAYRSKLSRPEIRRHKGEQLSDGDEIQIQWVILGDHVHVHCDASRELELRVSGNRLDLTIDKSRMGSGRKARKIC